MRPTEDGRNEYNTKRKSGSIRALFHARLSNLQIPFSTIQDLLLIFHLTFHRRASVLLSAKKAQITPVFAFARALLDLRFQQVNKGSKNKSPARSESFVLAHSAALLCPSNALAQQEQLASLAPSCMCARGRI